MGNLVRVVLGPRDLGGDFPYIRYLAGLCCQDWKIMWQDLDEIVEHYLFTLSKEDREKFQAEIASLIVVSESESSDALFHRYWYGQGAQLIPTESHFRDFLDYIQQRIPI